MNLEQAIHQRWAAASELNALLAAANLRTGLARNATVPYATLTPRSSRTIVRTNAGDALEHVTLAIHVWHHQFDAAQAIADMVDAVFDRSEFDLAGADRVIQMRRTARAATQHPDGLWQCTIEFDVHVYLASGH